jgi:hypothetical protein
MLAGLLRNAVENTPDGGSIEIQVRPVEGMVELAVRDFGTGVPREDEALLFETVYPTTDTPQYASRRPYDFNAGGSGFDLLRMKIFSERYRFEIHLQTERCRHIPAKEDCCPGEIAACGHCRNSEDCRRCGGTTVTVTFPSVERLVRAIPREEDPATAEERSRCS